MKYNTLLSSHAPLSCLTLLSFLTLPLGLWSTDKPKRTMHYFPVGREIVCINGQNRYTRALYGSESNFRLETSDRPVFATFKKKESKNIRLYLTTNVGTEGGTDRPYTLQLDETSFCEARYEGGRRTYVVRDEHWPKDATLRIYVMASFSDESAIWQFVAEGFGKDTRLEAKMCGIASTKFNRDGDLGTDKREIFEASADETDLQVVDWDAEGETYLLLRDNSRLLTPTRDEGRREFDETETARRRLTTQVVFTTPDAFINTLGATLTHAANGLWDGSTWNHGCIGWHTPLAGWRGCYYGDALGFAERSLNHYRAYAASMVTEVEPTLPHPTQDADKAMSRAVKQWGTQMYSNGYICRYPNRTDVMHHYDMNLNYIDGLLWHFGYDARAGVLREFWPKLQLHLAWEKRNYDPDGDHLYDAYCCIWASDALYYNSGAVTHSSAYNYRGNRLAARIAEIIGEDPTPYQQEADAILAAMNQRLWMPDRGAWAEYQDFMGLKRLHRSAALWSIYTPIDCGACTPEQAYQATMYVDRDIPHIPMAFDVDTAALRYLTKEEPSLGDLLATIGQQHYRSLSTTDWQPYIWSTNNVAHQEVANMALAYFEAGRTESGFALLKSDILDEMFLGQSPGNIGQISYYDKALKEAYRDFGDNVGVLSRTLINGLFGILPNALYDECIVRPSFPKEWQQASVKTPYLSYDYRQEGDLEIYDIEQHFAQPLRIVVRVHAGGGAFLEVAGTKAERQTIVVDRRQLPPPNIYPKIKPNKADVASEAYLTAMGLDEITPDGQEQRRMVALTDYYNAEVDDIFRNEYRSPRSPYTTLQIPLQGVGQWCHPETLPLIDDDGLRQTISAEGLYDTGLGLTFGLPKEGKNIVYTSLWDNYPTRVDIALGGTERRRFAYLMMAGSTNSMQSRIDNGLVVAHYSDLTTDTLHLENPINWCPIDEEYIHDDQAFWSASLQPYRFHLGSGMVSRLLKDDLIRTGRMPSYGSDGFGDLQGGKGYNERSIMAGAGVLLKMPLNDKKMIESISVETLSNDVVIGLMGLTLE